MFTLYTPQRAWMVWGGVGRKHRDLKEALKSRLHKMADESGEAWMNHLPWVLLGRRTAYQQDLEATSAELVFGANPLIPGDMVGEPGPPLKAEQLRSLLDSLRAQADKPAIQTSNHRDPPVHEPTNLEQVTHVRLKRHKLGPLQHSYEGPFPILERVGKSCIKVQVGLYADGTPRVETHHWENTKPAVLEDDQQPATKKKLGRKPKSVTNSPSETNTDEVNNSEESGTNITSETTNNKRPKRTIRPPARYAG